MPPSPQTLRLPDGQAYTVAPVLAGVGFHSVGHSAHHHSYPVGWTVVLHTDDDADEGAADGGDGDEPMRTRPPPVAAARQPLRVHLAPPDLLPAGAAAVRPHARRAPPAPAAAAAHGRCRVFALRPQRRPVPRLPRCLVVAAARAVIGPIGSDAPPDGHADRLLAMSDAALLEAWHANPRVAEFWGPFEPDGLDRALAAAHSFPVIGLWDGVPFGYFELYCVKEDLLGRHVGADVGDWDRGMHIMIGEEWARGKVATWLTSLVHWCLTADLRTMNVCLEPRIDKQR